jgi:SAM-dependent methyltransferase
MSVAYKLLYGIGFTPWEDLAEVPAIRDGVSELFAREEAEREPPYGPMLDLGCGSGIWAVEAAKRGWEVTGVDIVPKALRRARDRVHEAGVDVRLVEGDVTKLRSTEIGSDFSFFLDLGLFHDELTDEQRAAMGREVTALAAPGATLLMVAWELGRRGPLPRGASRDQIETAYPEWEVVDEVPVEQPRVSLYRFMRNPHTRIYRLRR